MGRASTTHDDTTRQSEIRDRRELLDFRLPDFTRLAWTSDRARAVWQPRLSRIADAWTEIEWRSVAAGLRNCHLTRLVPEALADRAGLWARHGLATLPLGVEARTLKGYSNTPQPARPGDEVVHCVVVGQLSSCLELADAWRRSDTVEIGRLLGFPACCCSFFEDLWGNRQRIDTVWPMVEACAPPRPLEPRRLEHPATLANILWRFVGVRAVPHLPCRLDCAPSLEMAEDWLALGEREGLVEEVRWLRQLLATPIQWSALHGIAEIKSPLLKISTATDATPLEYTVRLTGDHYPEAGALAPTFPYRQGRQSPLTQSPAFLRGMEHPIETLTHRPAWFHTDNGFSSRHGMEQLHAPLVKVARRHLAELQGRILDLGCGNGALLKRICQGRSDLEPWGVDLDPGRIAHGHELLPDDRQTILCDDFFHWMIEGPGAKRRYALALLMVGRLSEVPESTARQLLASVTACCDALLLYRYPDRPGDPGPALRSMAARFGLGFESLVEHCGLAIPLAKEAIPPPVEPSPSPQEPGTDPNPAHHGIRPLHPTEG